ncbi:hypothetical protein [Sphingobium sp. HDIP04]|uniref:hypothetical protein n=1 Tax=Sphingobium sp. HDIP04 TaxID=428994 RepID=UPI0003876EF8|nr:hypothetical protein [Sphingobium sp. HDIP04]EQA97320.1 hypothetical protein L286_23635 [Sphingobium sp. HDIP04]
MTAEFHQVGKQILLDGQHFADACTEEAAAQILAGLTGRASIAAYLDHQAELRGRWAGIYLRAMAANVRAGLDLEENEG